MSVNKARVDSFRRDIESLQAELSFLEFSRVFEAKLMDYASRQGNIKDIDSRTWRVLVSRLFAPEYRKFVGRTIGKFDAALDLVNSNYKDIGIDIQRDFKVIQHIEQITTNKLGQYGEIATTEIARRTRKTLIAGGGVDELSKSLMKVDTKVEHFADTIARTQVKGFSRVAKVQKARIGEVFFFEYVGIRRANTRSFCQAMIGQTHHIKDIRRMRNGQITPVKHYCGGYNCHHEFEPDPLYKAKDGRRIKWHTVALGKGRTLRYALAA